MQTPIHPFSDLTCRDLPKSAGFVSAPMAVCYWRLRCFAAPQYLLKRFALRLWQLNCLFAASSAPKLQYFPRTHSSCTCVPVLACTVCTGKSNNLAAPNCPVLDAWAKLYVQTARVLLGAWQRPRIRRRALRAPSLDLWTFPNVALRAVRLPLAELAIIVRSWLLSTRRGREASNAGGVPSTVA